MLKKLLVILAMLFASFGAFAAVDVNKATAAELDAVKGIGPVVSKRIMDERKKGGDFKSWEDFIKRVKGVGEGNAAKFSSEGLTVGGEGYKKAADAKKETKAEKKADKAEVKEAKKDEKAGKKAEKEAKKEEKKEAAAAAKPASAASKPAVAASKPASAAKK